MIVHPRDADERNALHRALSVAFDPPVPPADLATLDRRTNDGTAVLTAAQGLAWLDTIGAGGAIDATPAQVLVLRTLLHVHGGRRGTAYADLLADLMAGRAAPLLRPATPARWAPRVWRDLTIDLWVAACRAAGDPAAPAELRAGGLSRVRPTDVCAIPRVKIVAIKPQHRGSTSGVARTPPHDVSECSVTYRDGSHASDARRLMTVIHEMAHVVAPVEANHDAPWRRVYCALLSYAWGLDVRWDAVGKREPAYQTADGRGGLDGRVHTALEGQERRILARAHKIAEARAALR